MIIMTNNNTTTTAAAAVNLPIHSTDRIPPPPPSVAPHSHSTDMSPLTAVLSLLILVAVPALIYALFFAINCPRISLGRARRRRQGGVDSSYASSSGGAGKESKPLELASGGFQYSKEADGEEKYGSECPVCLSAFSEGDLLRQLGDCKHTFHVACIGKWLCSHSNCPVCRASVPTLIPAGRMKRPAPAVEDDFRQGLPDAASLV